jgi:hypothetical protein
MAGVARQEHAAEAQRLGDEAAQRGDAFLQAGAGHQLVAAFVIQAQLQLLPERVVAPVLHVVRQRHLQVVAAARLAALAAQGKAARAVDVDQLVADRRGVGQQAQPAEGVDLLVFGDGRARRAGAAHAVEAVAAGDEVAVQAVRLAVLVPGDVGAGGAEVVHGGVAGLVDRGQPGHGARLHQVVRDLGLAVHHHVLAAAVPVQVHAVAPAVPHQLDAAMHQAFLCMRAHAGRVQQVDADLLQDAGADAAQHVVAARAR